MDSPEMLNNSNAPLLVGVAVSTILMTAIFWRRRQSTNTKSNLPPMAEGGIPLLGNAISYQKNPPQFLRQQEQVLQSKVFQINLAGRHMIIVGSDAKAMQQVATQPGSVLSSPKAVAAVGFEYTLGPTNVYRGTEWHKRILKDTLFQGNTSTFEPNFLANLFQALDQALTRELSTTTTTRDMQQVPDLFHMVRATVLRATLQVLVGSCVLQHDESLLSALMEFQDNLEDVTAKAAVLPRWISLPLVLWPAARARVRMVQRLKDAIAPIWKQSANDDDDDSVGPWLRVYRSDPSVSPTLAAELILGLVFAAHKNPAIGAAQSFCFLQENAKDDILARAQQEAQELCTSFRSLTSNDTTAILLQATTLRKSVLETMRLTAHTIGAIRLAEQSFTIQTQASQTYEIPKGATVAISHHPMHMEESVWGPKAAEFCCNRSEWELQTKDIGSPVSPYKLTTFSNGVHKCPGERIAIATMEMVLALLLERKARVVHLPPVDFERATLGQRKGPVPIAVPSKL